MKLAVATTTTEHSEAEISTQDYDVGKQNQLLDLR